MARHGGPDPHTMKRFTKRALLGAIFFPLSSAVWGASAAFTLDTAAPSGFEDLIEPTTIVIDVYYGNRLLSQNVSATVTPDTVTFNDPQQLLSLLPTVKNTTAILQRLKQTLAANNHLICHTAAQKNCGVAEAQVLEVIYNPETFRADIFIGADFLTEATLLQDPYLPPATNRFAVSQQFSGNWSGARNLTYDDDPGGDSFTLFSDSVISFGEASLQARGSYSRAVGENRLNDQVRLSDAFWTKDYRGRAISAGLFQPAGIDSQFVSTNSIYGVELYRSDNTRLDATNNNGTPVEVHMPVSGRVEVYRNEQLIHSQMLEAGNRLLDTTLLPNGSYDISVVTYSEDGRPLGEFQQFFAKDSRLPPAGEWQWNILAGAAANPSTEDAIPGVTQELILQAGAARRLAENFGLSVGVAADETTRLVELGARWVSKYVDLTPSWLITDSGRSGTRINLSLRSPWATLTLQEASLEEPDTPNGDNLSAELLGQGYDYRSASAVIPFGKARVTARYSERDSAVGVSDPQLQLADRTFSSNRLTTLELLYPLLRSKDWNGDLRFGFNQSGDEQIWTLNFQLRQYGGHWNNSGYLRSESASSSGMEHYGGFSSSWNDGALWAADVQQQVNLEAGAGRQALRSNTRYAGRRGSINSSINYLNASEESLSYTGRFNTTFASDGDYFSWGGEGTYNSSVLVDINGTSDDLFEILVNGNRRGYAKGGDQSLVSIPAFDSYQVAVRPLGDGFYSYADQSDFITLYPGNMASKQYEIKSLVLVVGKVVRADKPVVNATFRIGEQKATTDKYGIFQLEYYAAPGKRKFTHIIWNNCQVPVPELSGDRSWLNLGSIDLNDAACVANQEERPLASTAP